MKNRKRKKKSRDMDMFGDLNYMVYEFWYGATIWI